jgi:hypothetical protein
MIGLVRIRKPRVAEDLSIGGVLSGGVASFAEGGEVVGEFGVCVVCVLREWGEWEGWGLVSDEVAGGLGGSCESAELSGGLMGDGGGREGGGWVVVGIGV